MANYKETNLAGVSWVRCRNITITNPIVGTKEPGSTSPAIPTAYFQEEKVISIDNVKTVMDVGSCFKKFELAKTINIRNPETGLATGSTATHQDLYVLLYSLYLQTAEERDILAT